MGGQGILEGLDGMASPFSSPPLAITFLSTQWLSYGKVQHVGPSVSTGFDSPFNQATPYAGWSCSILYLYKQYMPIVDHIRPAHSAFSSFFSLKSCVIRNSDYRFFLVINTVLLTLF